jgi:hypothetical protein
MMAPRTHFSASTLLGDEMLDNSRFKDRALTKKKIWS